MLCNVRNNVTSRMKERGYVDNNMIIINAMFFDQENSVKDLAKNKYGVRTNEMPFIKRELPSGKIKAIPNETFFSELQRKHDEYFSRNADQGRLFQKEGSTVSSKASPQLIRTVKDLLDRIGVSTEVVDKIVVNGVRMNSNAIANITQRLVQVMEGKEETSLPEEAMHFVVAIIKQTNPKLYQQLLKEINDYQILKQVFIDYGTDPNYLLPDGKVNVLKIKEEAIAKVLAETIINKDGGYTEKPELVAKANTWWQKILNWIKELFSKSGFDRAAMDVLSGKNIGNVEDIREEEGEIFQQKSAQSHVYDRLKEIASKLVIRNDKYYFEGKEVPRRVSDNIKDWYDRRFKNKDLTDSEWQKAINDLKAEKGTAGHLALQYAFSRLVDENGYVRETPLDENDYVEKNPNFNFDLYILLRNNLKERLAQYNKKSPNTRFLSEIMMYDAKRGLAGTADFVAITEEGNVNILDWKFMDLNVDKYEDVPWYKVNAWNQQMTQYKLMMEQVYGVKSQDIVEAMMIPIQAIYEPGDFETQKLPTLKEIRIGDVDVKSIEHAYLLPVALSTQKTGQKRVDNLIEKLNATYRKISEKKALPSEKISKAEQLNALFSAIRQLQMRQNIEPLVEQARIYNKMIKSVIERYGDEFKGKDPKSFTQAQINSFYEELETAFETLDIYTQLDSDLRPLYTEKDTDTEDIKNEKRRFKSEVADTVDTAREIKANLDEVMEEYVNDIIAGSEGVDDIIKPEKIIKGFTRIFGSTTSLQLKSMQVLFKKANRALGYAGMDTLTETKKLQRLKTNFDRWAAAKGLTIKDYFNILKKKDKNELIDEFNPEFYKNLKSQIANKNFDWIRENIDVEAYREYIAEKLKEEEERIRNKPRVGTDEEINQKINAELYKARNLYNLSTDTSVGWLLYDDLRKFPNREKWESNEWKKLTAKGNEAAKAFYDYIREKNDEYAELGYITRAEARVFLPFVRKGLMEKIIFGGKVSLGEQFLRAISLDEGDVGFGQIDPLTGRSIDTIPIYFAKEIDGEVSTDIFRTMALYNEMAIKYKHLSDIDAQVRALVTLERNKKAIATSFFGKTQYKEGELQYTPNNNENAQLIEDMAKAIVYGQKFLESQSFDQLLGKVGDWGSKFNKALGIKLFPETLSERQISANKVINQINNTFQIQTLGLNPLSSLSNLFGGTAQSIINSGKYFTRAEFISSELWLSSAKMTGGEDQKKFVAALEYFLPLTDNYNKEIAKTLSLSKLSQERIQEFLMILMRNSDLFVQTANFRSFLLNAIVINGEVINARDYLRKQPEYANKYKGTPEQRRKIEQEFDNKVKQLIEEKGVMKLATIKDGEFVIPGIERKSDSVIEFRRKVQQLSKDALGNLSEDDIRLINLNILGKSFMIFKNWIPRLVDVRFGNLKYNNASDAYEWGRMRVVFDMLSVNLLASVGRLRNAMVANEEGVAYMREMFERKKAKYKEDTGKVLDMNEAQFMDLVRQNIRSQMRDVLLLLTLMALYAGLKANMPDDDEDKKTKNQYRFLLKATDKLRDELMYFYNPTSIQGIISTGIFPSMRLVDNYSALVKNFMLENYYVAVGEEEKAEKNFVIKYALRGFPITKVGSSYIPMFYPDLAKDLGIKMQSQSGIR